MFSRDEMQRAIEDALKSMEGIALELYRRGREPLLAELEDCRARKADLCTMLERVATERDKAEAELRDLQRRTSEALAQAVEWQRERDEARREADRLRAQYAATVLEHAKMLSEAVDVSKRQKRLADRAHDQACRLAAKLDAQSTDQFRRGAEAMRMSVMQYLVRQQREATVMVVDTAIKGVHKLPILEEP